MSGSGTDLLAGPDLYQFAQIHDADPSRNVLDHGNGVGDEKIRETKLLLQIGEKVDDLSLN